MDEFIRLAYADGMLSDDDHVTQESMNYNSSSLYNTSVTATLTNRIPTPIDQSEELILLSDDDNDNNPCQTNTVSTPSSYNHQTAHILSSVPPPLPIVRSSVPKVSLPFTYLSLVRHQPFPLNTHYQDFSIKACFSSLASNPRVIKNEFDLQAYVNDGSDCILVRLASDLLAQRIGITVAELMAKRRECKNDFDKQKFQKDFNEQLKKFGHGMNHLNALMTIRIFSNHEIPMVIKIDES